MTGNTPGRTQYEYVRDITAPLVHRQLLTEFCSDKLTREEDMAANLALPLTDSESEDMSDSADLPLHGKESSVFSEDVSHSLLH